MINPDNFARKARLLATAAPFALVLAASPALAQQTTAPAAQEGQTAAADDGTDIVVTGTLFRRTDTETPSPVTVLKADDLEKRGINTVAEAVQRLSSNGSGAITQGWNNGSNFATGANAVSLRGLTVQSTLTIFDGLRMAPYPLADDGHRNFVDLNTLPDAVVDRIEVLKDGASSTYGADAIAGVVNVIMKKEVTGIHLNGSAGVSEHGDGGEQRLDATIGYGSLSEQGFNFYVSGEYQKNDVIMARDRGYPFNTNDLSRVCDPAAPTHCLANTVNFGVNSDGTLSSGTTTTANLVAPYVIGATTATTGRTGEYTLLNTAAGCAVAPGLSPTTLNATQRQFVTSATSLLSGKYNFAANQCTQDLRAQYQTIQPSQERYGGVMRFTANIGDSAQAYATASYYDVKTQTTSAPLAWAGATTAPQALTISSVLLPVYVCAAGVGSVNVVGGLNAITSSGCNAQNGTLNPNNPYAANGSLAILRGRYDQPRILQSDARSLRGALGINGTFGDSWSYSADFTISNVKLGVTSKNFLIPQRLADVIANGTYNFVDQSKNSQAIRDYIAPVNKNVSNSDLWQVQATIGRALFDLPGGPLQVAVGGAYRHESIDNPSANPFNGAHPYDRFYTINAVGAIGSRNVKSGFFEINAPILDVLEINGSGRYDDYSSGQSNFSPKIGAKFTPIKQIAVRGTFSKGFRIPSFNEAYGLPTTGFSTATVNCTTFATFCGQHPNSNPTPQNPYNTYVTTPYSLGTTLTGNPGLKPEKSRSFTGGIVIEPIRNVSFTIDYWNIEVKDLVSQVSPGDRNLAISQYYSNNGVVNIPGITVTPQGVDPAFPNALPLLGTINASYNNAGKENVSGIDFGANVTLPITNGLTLRSSFDAAYLLKYSLTRVDGTVERYDGTLSPCDYTSCSGSPKWRGSWQNTLDFGTASLTGTLYYTSGYDLAEVDYGGVKGDCQFNSEEGVGAPLYRGGTTPSQCEAKAQWNFDMSGQVKVADKFTLYVNVMNVFNIKPVTDYAAAYSLYQYNPAWGQANIIGRYFRVGAKVDF